MEEIIQEVLRRIKPTPQDKALIEEVISELKHKITYELKNEGLYDVKLELVGSVAKDTYLKDDVDIDFFLLFPPSLDIKTITNTTLKIGKRILENYSESYAQHPYARGTYRGFNIDLVPSYIISDPNNLKTAVDRTPLHTKFVRENLQENQKDEVRILKAFMKGIGVYGAESKIGGFSGYLCELLVIKYGSFLEVLRQATNWKKGTTLSLTPNSQERLFEERPLIFIDPVDNRRNAAAAVREDSMNMFILASRCFLKQPSINYFFPTKPSGSEKDILRFCEESGLKIYIIEINKPPIVEEILNSQLLKFCNVIKEILNSYRFMPRNIFYIIYENSVYIIFVIERDRIPRARVHVGPPIYSERALDFINKWNNRCISGPFIIKNRLYVLKPKDKTDVREILLEELKIRDIGKNLNSLKREIKIVPIEDVLYTLDSNLISEIYAGLIRRLPWVV